MKEWTPEQIRAFRESRGLLQREFAQVLGVTREYVNYLEKGVKQPSKTLKLFLDCLEREIKEKEKGKEVKKRYGNRNIQKG